MILLTVPVLFPAVVSFGFDPVWFWILIVVVVEIGMISPPVGMNLFVINAPLPHVPTATLFRGVAPFVVADVVRLLILIAFPAISIWLPAVLRIGGKGYWPARGRGVTRTEPRGPRRAEWSVDRRAERTGR